MTSLDRKLFRDLAHMRGQIVAVTLVLACGVGAYVTMRGAHQSLLAAQSEYYSAYRLADVFSHVKRAPEALVPAIEAIPGVEAVQTRIVMDVTLDIPGLEEPAVGRLVSLPGARPPALNAVFVRQGRYIEPNRRGEVLISEALAEANGLHPGDTISAVINGKWEPLRITGLALSPEYVYEVRPSEMFPDNRRFGVLWIDRAVIASAFNMEGAFNDVSISLARGASEQDVIARLDRMLDRYGSLGAYGHGEHVSWRIVSDHIEELRTSGYILPVIFLLIVAFLLHVLMSRLVSTQRPQVAVLKAFGYRGSEIGFHFLKLALVAVVAGAIAGTALGLWLGSGLMALFGRYFRFPSLQLYPDARVMLTAAAISGAAACLGAWSAVRRAVLLAPAEAMRPDSPARFRPGIFERTWLWKLLPPAVRMILRNLGRRPARAFLSALAVGFAVAILVVGWYRMDAVEQLADVQFNYLQREDVTVVLREPGSAPVIHDLSRLPGVLRVEPFREVPVRLRFKHAVRRVAILGLTRGAELRAPRDVQLRKLDLPPEGLVLNTRLAEILQIRPGEMATVEVLEGERPVRSIRVAALAEEPVGLGAYMEIGALHRMMRESDLVSGAYLSVDVLAASKLYGILKRSPAVSGVAVREAIETGFWKAIGESIMTTTAVLVGFACAIAFGIVYNGARIALSERGNELASLRVLGFTRVEIGRVLLGEQGVLMLLATPVGFAMGFGLSLWISKTHSPDLLRLPFVVDSGTYGFSALVVGLAALASGLVVARRLARMDLTAVLKSRE